MVLSVLCCGKSFSNDVISGANSGASNFSVDSDRLVIASYPYASPAILVTRFKPLIEFLEEQTQKKVFLEVLSSYQELLTAEASEKCDLVACPSHLALALWQDQQFSPVMLWLGTFSSRILVKKNAPYKTLADLKMQTIAIPDRLALVTLAMERKLIEQSLVAMRDYQFRVRSTHDRALYALITGEVDAAIISSSFHGKLQPPFRESIRVLSEIDGLVSDVYLLSPNSSLLKKPGLFERFISSEYYEPYKQVWGIPDGMITRNIQRKLLLMKSYKPESDRP